jgi:hypothetical protein
MGGQVAMQPADAMREQRGEQSMALVIKVAAVVRDMWEQKARLAAREPRVQRRESHHRHLGRM